MMKAIGLFISMILLSTAVHAGELEGVRRNNKGAKLFGAGKTVEAFDQFSGALADLPFSPVVHANLGTSFLGNKEYEKALSEYAEAIRLAPGNSRQEQEVKFYALFNSATALTEMKKIDEALATYQQALEIHPDSVEVKTNIELITKSQSGDGQGDSQDQKDQKDQKDNKDKKDGKGKDNKDDKDKKDDKKDDKDSKNDQQKPPPKYTNEPKQKPTPHPFKSEDINQQDVGRILEELKHQEEAIRARIQDHDVKEAPPDKDW
jgi:Ca-activated chloride channel homolog